MSFSQRQTQLRQRMEQEGVEAVLVAHLPNLRYLCGFSGSNGLLLVEQERATLYTDGRYREQARSEVQQARVEVPARGELWKAAAQRARRQRRVGMEYEHLTLTQRARWLAAWGGGARGLKNASGWVEQQRAIKAPEEVAAIRRAVELASSVFAPTVRKIRAGMSETELAGWLEFALRKAGGEGLAFDSIIAGGQHGAWVHAHPDGRPLPRRGFVVMDYGVVLGGYHSDMTRSVHLGAAGRRAREVYRAVLEAQQAAIAAVRPGARCAAVDRAARRSLEQAGMGKYFPHSTGHGVGLEIHEAPRLGATSRETLAAGQVITIEPGVYLPGWGGVRIEDVVLVTPAGAEVLTPTPKELIYGL
ncbi:MAG TPA: Xaa-Pro peptidase family protein [Terriglobales bacterium]|nr:Xaa-Pro peptidase family protein [Terriglobales bacterium]